MICLTINIFQYVFFNNEIIAIDRLIGDHLIIELSIKPLKKNPVRSQFPYDTHDTLCQ